MGSIVDDELMNAVRATLYSGYSLILMKLTETNEQDADTWLRLTARGMGVSPASLAWDLVEYNRGKMNHVESWLNERGPSND